jgi:hypothetical protein
MWSAHSCSRSFKRAIFGLSFALFASCAWGQIQVDLKLPRLQYIAYEPVIATVGITNLAGRDIELRDGAGQPWFGLEITGQDGQLIGMVKAAAQPPLTIETGKRVTQKIDVGSLFAVHDFGAYHARAHIYFADLGKYFYSPAKVFEVTDARPIWQRTVGIPDQTDARGDIRTYSLLTNRFPDHTSLYVRVEDRDHGIVYATYSLGRIIAFDEPHAELDRANQLHVLFCAAPRTWTYHRVGLNGERISHATFMETKSRPRLVRSGEGEVKIAGGMMEAPATAETRSTAPKLSQRPPKAPDQH